MNSGSADSLAVTVSRPAGAAVLVAQHFLPLNVVASQRALRMARALLERFERVYVICADSRDVDPTLLDHEYGRDVLQNRRLVRLDTRPMLTGYGLGRRRSLGHRLVGATTTRLLCGPGVDWIPPLRRALASIAQSAQVRLVLATGPPFITFGTVTRWATSRSAAVILDYRDLWTSNPHAAYPRLAAALVNRWIERRVNRSASVLTTVSEGCKASLQTGDADISIRVLYNAPDTAYLQHYLRLVEEQRRREPLPRPPRRPLQIVFAGQVYRNCTFAPLLQALRAVRAAIVEQVQVHYYGDSSAVARREFEQFGLAQMLVDHGKVSKDDSVRAILDADVLLSLIHTARVSSDPAITGHMTTKLYDYFLSGRPILNIGPVNAEVNQFAAQLGYEGFYTFPAEDTTAMGQWLERAVGGETSSQAPLSVALPSFDVTFTRILQEALNG